MNRRVLLRATLAAPLALALPGRGAAMMSAWRVIVHTSDGVAALDPGDGTAVPLRPPDDLRRAQWLPGVQRLLLDAGERVLIRDPSGAGPDRAISAPVTVVAGRVISTNRTLLDLVTNRRHRLPDGVTPETTALLHPTRHAAALDVRTAGGGLVILPAGPDREPWWTVIPDEASIAIGPDGRSLLVSLGNGLGSSLYRVARFHSAIDRPILETDVPLVLHGPVGASGVVLAQIGEAALALLDAAGRIERVPMAESGRVTSWQTDRQGDGIVLAWEGGGEVAWWHLLAGGAAARRLDAMPLNLVMAGMPGEARGWVHGAVARRDGLGSGELRLLAVDPVMGEVALDISANRRLELAATAVRGDGTVLAHVQAGNTRVDLDVVVLPGHVRRVSVPIVGAPAAAAEIDLRVEGDVVAAGLRWGDPDHHAPVVIAVGESGGDAVTIEGDLIGVVPVETVAVD